MKHIVRSLFVLTAFAFLLAGAAVAQEKVPVDIISSRLEQQSNFASPYLVTLTSSGKLITQPGSVFSEGVIDQDEKLPSLLSNPQLVPYPAWALQEGREGEVVIALEVRVDGSVGQTMIMQTSGHSDLDEFAQKLVKTWRFHPAMKGDIPIVECIQIPISFQIE